VPHRASLCGIVLHMDATRKEKISVNLPPELAARLDRFAKRNHWSRSTAAAVLIERGLDADEPE
jgi:metal-responsive CopG/Arc/MetJ family transcriptional regulator